MGILPAKIQFKNKLTLLYFFVAFLIGSIYIICMKTKIPVTACESFGHSLFRLPITINGCDYLYQYYAYGDDFSGNQIGVLEGRGFVCKYYCNVEDDFEDHFLIDSDLLSTENKLT